MEEIKYSESEEPKAKKQESALPKRDNGGFIVYISKGRTEVLPFVVLFPNKCWTPKWIFFVGRHKCE